MSATNYSSTRAKKGSLKVGTNQKKIVLWGGILAVAILCSILVMLLAKNFRSPANGTIKLGTNEAQSTLGYQTDTLLEGQTFTLLHDSQYQSSAVSDNKSFLEQHQLNRQIEKLNGSSRIGVSVRSYPDDDLDSEPAYKIRKVNPAKYKQDQKSFNNNAVIVFENVSNNEFEMTAFLQNKAKNILGIITLSSSEVSGEELTKEFNKLIESFAWL